MKFIFIDLDETLITSEQRFKSLSSWQLDQVDKTRSIELAKQTCYPIYWQLHHLVFKYIYNNPDEFKLIIMTYSSHRRNRVREQMGQLFETRLFESTHQNEVWSQQHEALQKTPWLDLNWYGRISKTLKINQYFQLSRKSFDPGSCYLIDDKKANLLHAAQNDISVIHSCAPDYHTELSTLVFGEPLAFARDAR